MKRNMGRTASFPLHDRLMGGKLGPLIRAWRNEDPKVSYEVIAQRLRIEHGVSVSTATVRRWALHFGLEDQPTKAVGE